MFAPRGLWVVNDRHVYSDLWVFEHLQEFIHSYDAVEVTAGQQIKQFSRLSLFCTVEIIIEELWRIKNNAQQKQLLLFKLFLKVLYVITLTVPEHKIL